MRKKSIHCPMCDKTKHETIRTGPLFHVTRFYELMGLKETVKSLFWLLIMPRPKHVYECKHCSMEFY